MGRESAFGGRGGGGDVGGGGGGHDVGDHVVDADRFTLGEGTEGDLDLGHAIGVWVVFGVFAEFLGVVVVSLAERGGLGRAGG